MCMGTTAYQVQGHQTTCTHETALYFTACFSKDSVKKQLPTVKHKFLSAGIKSFKISSPLNIVSNPSYTSTPNNVLSHLFQQTSSLSQFSTHSLLYNWSPYAFYQRKSFWKFVWMSTAALITSFCQMSQ